MKILTVNPLAHAAQQALGVQNACNLAGVLGAWQRVQTILADACGGNATDKYRTHPVNILFLSKVVSLMGCGTDAIGGVYRGEADLFREAYEACQRAVDGAAGPTPTVEKSLEVSPT